ncbi:MAG TPA: DUF2911 domain-containing protein [Candidatus Binatia bacterium]|nr:DUF2911 domain-containing protein [Candidatus Binatia bacterium]
MQQVFVPRLRLARSALVALAIVSTSAHAQTAAPELPQPSPLAKIEQRVGVTTFAIEYSSPGVKGRTVWGDLVPHDEMWRTGANAPTKLTASRDFTFGDKKVPAGSYVMLTIPTAGQWTFILYSDLKIQGTRGYDQTKDVARVTVQPEAAPHRERLTFLFSDTTDSTTRLDLEWEKQRISIPITVDTAAHARESIDKTLAEAWRPHWASARYLLDSGGDLDLAISYIDTSIGIKSIWWNHWVKAQILAKQGKKAEAVVAAEQAQGLGKGDVIYETAFQDDVNKSLTEWRQP